MFSGVVLGGFGVYRGNLYGDQYHGDTLYPVNPANGSLTAVGRGATSDFNLFGSTTRGLYVLDSNLISILPLSDCRGRLSLVHSAKK